MTHGRLLAAALPTALALLAPAAAGAACAQRPLEQIVREVPIVVTAKAQPGPLARNNIGLLSPAAFKVVSYDQGSGPADLKVRTALANDSGALAVNAEGVNPIPGQTWHLWGTLDADGVLQTSLCLGSTLAGAQQAPSLGASTLRVANFAGTPRGGPLPTVTAPRGGRVVLQLPAREANFPVSPDLARSLVTVQVRRGASITTVAPRWSARDGVLSAKVAAPPRGSETLVVITQAASYAVRLRAG